jgi:hypothetical protein
MCVEVCFGYEPKLEEGWVSDELSVRYDGGRVSTLGQTKAKPGIRDGRTKMLSKMAEQLELIGSAECREPLGEVLDTSYLLVSLIEIQHLEEDGPKAKLKDLTHQHPYHSTTKRTQSLPKIVDVASLAERTVVPILEPD